MEATVNSLPSEILEIILSYCTPRDLVHSIQHVCLRWQEVVQSTRVWKDVTYCPDHYATSKEVVEMLKISPKLQNITLQHKYDDSVLKTITDNCVELRKLDLIDHPDLELNFLKTLQEKCRKVEYLSIPQQVLSDINKCEVVGQFTHLKVLHLTEFPSTRFLLNLTPIADNCRELEDLEISSIMFTMSDLYHLLSTRKDTLHTLGVRCSNTFDECVLPTLSVSELKSLSIFGYRDCKRHHEKSKHFRKLKTVIKLKLTEFSSRNESDDLKDIFENKSMAQLVKLNINRSYYFDDNVTEVIVTNCPLLKTLSLIDCPNITDTSLEMMTKLKGLYSLTVSKDSTVTNKGLNNMQNINHVKCLRI